MTDELSPDVIAAYEYVDSVIDTADDKHNIMWHGWALREAFLKGIAREREKCIKELEYQFALQLATGANNDELNQAQRCIDAIRNRKEE